ncbi:hypothetical protein AMR41_24700 [Hapalosiphon sp. MRB220]|nr:hypothetical protein AMR41_24700 [Hapalosiphon sp. MRB220]
MKRLLVNLVVLVSTLSVIPSAYANPVNSQITNRNNRADFLVTKPITIKNNWGNVSNQNNRLRQTAGSISVVRQQGCTKIDPLEILQNPGLIIKECEERKNQTPEYLQPIEYFKTPKQINSGVNVTVTKF